MSLRSYQRPAFWKVPHYVSESFASPKDEPMPDESTPQTTMICKPALISNGAAAPGGSDGGGGGGGGGGALAYAGSRRNSGIKKRVHFEDELWPQVQCGSPAYGEVLRGDVISKIGEYDGRDLSHADAQHLFRSAGNEISLVVHRDSKIAYTQGISNESSRCNSTVPPAGSPDLLNQPHRAPSPFLPGPGHYDRAIQMPVDTLPHTVFPKLNQSGGYVAPSAGGSFSPMPTRDHQQEVAVEQAAIVNQPYRTTPLVLPGAKVKKDAPTTESYLRHYPNPAVRAHPGHDYHDSVMKQRVADTMLHRVVGQDADTGRVFHKQFNSPIGLYSEGNIENTIRQTVPFAATTECAPRVWTSPLHRPLPTKLARYKNTLVYDPSKSETYRAIQEEGYGASTVPHEVTIPVQTKVFHPNRMVPGKKPVSAAAPVSGPSYNVVNSQDDAIRQSGSFNRLMYSVLGASEY